MDGISAQILITVITVVGLYIVAKVNTKSGKEASSVESALKLQKRYEEMNDKLEKEMGILKTEFDSKIYKVQKEMEKMKRTFEEKENYYKSEIEKRDDRIDELELENTTLRIENVNLKGGIKHGI